MDFKVEIEYWDNGKGYCPISDFIENEVPKEHQGWLAKRDEFLERHTMRQLFSTPYIDWAEGSTDFIEVKYVGSRGRNYRAVAIIWKGLLVYLIFFRGSGSRGRLVKYFPQASVRAGDWKKRHP